MLISIASMKKEMTLEATTYDVKTGLRTVLILGAGIHCTATVKNTFGEAFRQKWPSARNVFRNGGELGFPRNAL